MARAYLGLGANVGNRRENLSMAVRLIGERCAVVSVSSLYRSEAVVLEGQAPGPDYLNAACEVTTDLSPQELLRFAKRIEHDIGRRPAGRWAPRPIDVDILLYDDAVIDTPELTVPHPCLAERSFVIVPLAELAAGVAHPLLRATIGELAADVDLTGLEHLEGPEWAATEDQEART